MDTQEVMLHGDQVISEEVDDDALYAAEVAFMEWRRGQWEEDDIDAAYEEYIERRDADADFPF